MNDLLRQLSGVFDGDIICDTSTLKTYSHDASIYELTPEAVLVPKSVRNVSQLVTFVHEHKALYPSLSITPRGAGTCMSGGAINTSFILDMTKNFNTIVGLEEDILTVEPGVYMRDIDTFLADYSMTIGAVPASRAFCTIGGMVANNSGGEQSLRHGNIVNSVVELSAVLADGKEYTFKPLSHRELAAKCRLDTFEGTFYRSIEKLIKADYDRIRNARPNVHKNSMGYNLWDVWNKETGVFDLTKLFCGSQGTLGIITRIKIRTIRKPAHVGMLVMYVKSPRRIGDIVALVSRHNPLTFEGFDDVTFNLGLKNFSQFKKQLGAKTWAKEQSALLRSVVKFKGHLPNMVLMAEFDGVDENEVTRKISRLKHDLQPYRIDTMIAGQEAAAPGYWQLRRASLALLREKVKDKYAAPFIDDLTVNPQYLHDFLPKLRKIIKRYQLSATIAGHFGDGNFHIIPLMDISDPKEQAKLEPIMREVVKLVLEYGGSLAGEHNDGLIRGPWLTAMFGERMVDDFRQVKDIFDSANIFNPHKKTDASWDFSMNSIRHDRTNELIVLKNT